MSTVIAYSDIGVKDIYSFRGNTLQAIEKMTVGVYIPDGYTLPVRTVGQNVAAIRERMKGSQSRLADELGMKQPSMWKIEHSKTLPEVSTLLKLAKILGCSVDELLHGVDPAYDKNVIARRDLIDHDAQGKSDLTRRSDVSSADRAFGEEALKLFESFHRAVSDVASNLNRVVANAKAQRPTRPSSRASSGGTGRDRKVG